LKMGSVWKALKSTRTYERDKRAKKEQKGEYRSLEAGAANDKTKYGEKGIPLKRYAPLAGGNKRFRKPVLGPGPLETERTRKESLRRLERIKKHKKGNSESLLDKVKRFQVP